MSYSAWEARWERELDRQYDEADYEADLADEAFGILAADGITDPTDEQVEEKVDELRRRDEMHTEDAEVERRLSAREDRDLLEAEEFYRGL